MAEWSAKPIYKHCYVLFLSMGIASYQSYKNNTKTGFVVCLAGEEIKSRDLEDCAYARG